MIGQATAPFADWTTAFLRKKWGYLDTNARQKWQAIWPHYLQELRYTSLHILDAGCGKGDWAFELATQCPNWFVKGIDKSALDIAEAKTMQQKLELGNLAFEAVNFLNYQPTQSFDIVLSVASAHYLVEENQGEALFYQFHDWLKQKGKLILLAPRCKSEVPTIPWLPSLPSKQRDIFSYQDLVSLCAKGRLSIVSLRPVIFKWGTIAKQFSILDSKLGGFKLLYPLEIFLTQLETRNQHKKNQEKSSMWILIAERNDDNSTTAI